MYNDEWTPKKVMSIVDEHWGDWLFMADKIENENK